MPQSTHTFRVFVSSTFSDLKAERHALQTYVFPRLRDLTMSHSCRFQAIDLRWGVSEEAALDQQTMRICLGEIERCQKVSPRPNFIVLLGNRFGWRPLPYAIPADEFELLISNLGEEEKGLLCWREEQKEGQKGWYQRDNNAVPPEYLLQPRQTGTRFEDFDTWVNEVEKPLVAALERAAQAAKLDEGARVKYTQSATGQEIVNGALKVPDAGGKVFGFFRSIENLEQVTDPTFIDADFEARERLAALKRTLRTKLQGNIYEYSALWEGTGISENHIGSLPQKLEACLRLNKSNKPPANLCEAVWLCLSNVMLDEISRLDSEDALERDQKAHTEFGMERGQFFSGQEDTLERIAGYLSGNDNHPLVVWGPSGSGKSALLAKAIESVPRKKKSRLVLVSRFIGATPESSSTRSLLESICRQINRAYAGDETTVPMDLEALVAHFPGLLAKASREKPLVLFVDALDQLTDSQEAIRQGWLPSVLPPDVKLVVSTLPGKGKDILQRRLPLASLVPLPELSREAAENLLASWLKNAHRALTDEQRQDILHKFKGGGGLPLYLKLAFEEARHWHSYDGLPIYWDAAPGLGENIDGIIRDLFWRLGQENQHGMILLSHVLGYLSASNQGLSEDELLDLLWANRAVKADFFRRSPKSPGQVDALPVVIWARLFMDLEPYLILRDADGATLIGFFHRQIAEAAREAYLSPECHGELADYYQAQPLYLDRLEQAPNLRKLSEMMHQLAYACRAMQVEQALLDFAYIRAKIAGQGVRDLIKDYDLAAKAGVRDEKLKTLSLLQKALRLSAHMLDQMPDQLPAQLTGRLLAFLESDMQDLLKQVRTSVRTPWLRPVSLCMDAPNGTLVNTVSAGRERYDFSNAALTPDGRHAVLAYKDYTLKVWDLEVGINLGTMRGHTGLISDVKITSDGRRVLSASEDHTLRIWDLETGNCLHTFTGHSGKVNSVTISRDGTCALSASDDQSLKIWNLSHWECVLSMVGTAGYLGASFTSDGRYIIAATHQHTLEVWNVISSKMERTIPGWLPEKRGKVEVALSADGRYVVAADSNDTLKAWDIRSGECKNKFYGHKYSPGDIVLSPDGHYIVSVAVFNTLKVWEIETGNCVYTLEGHLHEVNKVAFTPDGRWILSGSTDHTVRIWDLASGECLHTLNSNAGGIDDMLVSQDGQYAVSVCSTFGVLDLWSLAESSLNSRYDIQPPSWKGGANKLALTRDGRQVVTFSEMEQDLKIWDMQHGMLLRSTRVEGQRQCSGFILTPDSGTALWTSLFESSIMAMELKQKQYHLMRNARLAVTPDGRCVVLTSHKEKYTMMNGIRLPNPRLWETIPAVEGLFVPRLEEMMLWNRLLVMTPDLRCVITPCADGTIKIWDLSMGKCLRSLEGHTGDISGLALSPDGRSLVSSDQKGTIKIWDLESGACLRTLPGENDLLEDIQLSPDGHLAITLSSGRVKVRDLETGCCLASFIASQTAMVSISPISTEGTLVAGDFNGRVYFLHLDNVVSGPPILTAWRKSFRALFVRVSQPAHFCCPYCQAWPEIPQSALGTVLPCPNCGKEVKINPFTIEADWQLMTKTKK